MNAHESATTLEARICTEFTRIKMDHEHRSLRFRVRGADDRDVPFAPAITVRRGSILFLIEPVPTADPSVLDRFARFLDQHSPEIVFVLVAEDRLLDRIPAAAYDEIYPASNVLSLARRIAEQPPDGVVRPFDKPGPR